MLGSAQTGPQGNPVRDGILTPIHEDAKFSDSIQFPSDYGPGFLLPDRAGRIRHQTRTRNRRAKKSSASSPTTIGMAIGQAVVKTRISARASKPISEAAPTYIAAARSLSFHQVRVKNSCVRLEYTFACGSSRGSFDVVSITSPTDSGARLYLPAGYRRRGAR